MTPLHITPGSVHTGVWHQACMTSGGWYVHVYTLHPTGPHPIGSLRGCVRCDEEEH